MTTTLTRYNQFVALWELVVPEFPLPRQSQIIHWISRYSDEDIETAVTQLPRWVHAKRMGEGLRDAEAPYRYVGSTLVRMQLTKKEQEAASN